jgi:endogenous inhibitor of DNA gyrase (YacG/DUF329 family)
MMMARCPICDRVIESERLQESPWRPFCSQRCRTIDLGRWLGEQYRMPAVDAGADPAEELDAEPPPC